MTGIMATDPKKASVFLSHSTLDGHLVQVVREQATTLGVNVYLHEEHPEPGVQLSTKLIEAIERSDALIVLITRNASASNFVNQEIGVALGKQKPIIPLVEKGVSANLLAMLQGVEYVPFDATDLSSSLSTLTSRIHHLQATRATAQIRALENQVENQRQALVAMSLVALVLLILLAYSEFRR